MNAPDRGMALALALAHDRLDEALAYFADREDASVEGSPPAYVPSEEMRRANDVRQVRAQLRRIAAALGHEIPNPD